MSKAKSSANTAGERQKFYFQFITTPTADTSGTSLLLHFDNRRYFFGRISEGTQRACIQRGIGIKKVRNMFLTGPTSWDNMGGLLGMILTMADVQADEIDPMTGKKPRIRIQGGPRLMHSIACARRFVFRTGMPLQCYESDPDRETLGSPTYVDDNISVWSVPVNNRGQHGSPESHLPSGRSQSPGTVSREQELRAETVKNMFDSDWRKDRLVESRFDQVKLPALVWTRDPQTKNLTSTQCTTMADAPHLQPESKVFVRNPWPASLVQTLPSADNVLGSVAMSYIVKGKPQRGKFLPLKAKELGVTPGPDYAILTGGGSIVLKDGTTVTPEMVLGKAEPGKGMAILDVPSEEYLEDLSEKLKVLSEQVMEGIETVSWILGRDVVFNPAFTNLVESLRDIKHIVSSPDTSSNYLTFDSAAASSVRLAQIRPGCFQVPKHDNSVNAQHLPQGVSCNPAERGMIVQVAPKWILNRTEIPPLLDIETTKSSYKDILRDLMPTSTASNEETKAHDDVQIITLGTGSAVPSKYRNVSATLVRIPNEGSHLFDCGENTLGTLRRVYTATELDEMLVDLRMIWISHLHADHHLGTLSIVEAKREAMQRSGKTEPKLHIVSEPNMADYLNDYNSIQSSAHCQLLGVRNSQFMIKNGSSYGSAIDISETTLPIKEFLTTSVSHCHGAQACSVTFSNGFKFSYSGDCRPSAQFALIGQNSDVLLHEATFDDGLEGDAMAKKHSTTGEALAVAHAMKAKNVVLTHFSQRYQKLPVLNRVKFGDVRFEEANDADEAGPVEENMSSNTADQVPLGSAEAASNLALTELGESDSVTALQKIAHEMNVCVAFDMMSINVGQIRDMYMYYPAIEKMFEHEHEKSEAVKGERREANERMTRAKEIKENRWKGPQTVSTSKKDEQPSASKGDNLYERINRNKVKSSNKKVNDSITQANARDELTESSTTTTVQGGGGDSGGVASISASSQSLPRAPVQMGKKKLNRLQRQIERTQAALATNSLETPALDSGSVRLTRQLSAQPEDIDPKRPRLDNDSV